MHRVLTLTAAAGLLLIAAPVAVLGQDGPTVLTETQACADLGRKQPGEPAGLAQAERIAERFAAANLDVEFEEFHVPVFDVGEVSIEVVAPTQTTYEGSSFAYGGTGIVEAEVVNVGSGRASDYAGVDAEGRIVLVERDLTFHRSAQLNEVEAHGGVAMLYVSAAPDNLVQVGTVRFAQHPPPHIPTVTVGADDGAELAALADAGDLRMRLEVDAERRDAVGVNVIGTRVGTTYPDDIILVGGHYDSWYDGAVDNCSAIGSMLQIAQDVADVDLAYTVVFGAWDAEEIGLVGSYDWVMKHPDLVERVVVNENLEMTSAATQVGSLELPHSVVNLIFGTTGPVLNGVIATSMAATGHVAAPTTANGVRQIQGGIIPTDLQPFYTLGVQGFSTFSNSAYYHTVEDDTSHIPSDSHVRVTDFLERFLLDIQDVPPEALRLREVPTVEVRVPEEVTVGESVPVEIEVTDLLGQGIAGGDVRLLVNERDHWPVLLESAVDAGGGTYTFEVPGEAVDEAGDLWFTASLSADLYAAEGHASTRVTGAGVPTPEATTTPTPGPTGQGEGSSGGPSLPATGGGLAVAGLVLVVVAARRR